MRLNTLLNYLANDLRLKPITKNKLSAAYPQSKVRFIKWKQGKTVEYSEIKFKHDEENVDLKQLRLRLRSIGDVVRAPGQEFKVFNSVSGPAQKFYKTYDLSVLVDLDEQHKNQSLKVGCVIPFDYTQRPWMNTLSISVLDADSNLITKIPIMKNTFDFKLSNRDEQANTHP